MNDADATAAAVREEEPGVGGAAVEPGGGVQRCGAPAVPRLEVGANAFSGELE